MGSVMTRRTTISYVRQLRNPASDNYTMEPLELTLSFSSGLFSWLSSQKQNNMTHAYFGNIGIGVGVLTVYIRIKGCLSLHIKKSDIENIIKDYNPHVLGLGEANFWHDHDRADSEQPGYELHLDSSLDNLELGVARVAVYARKSFKVTRRADVECKNVSAVSLQCGLPHQKKYFDVYWLQAVEAYGTTRQHFSVYPSTAFKVVSLFGNMGKSTFRK